MSVVTLKTDCLTSMTSGDMEFGNKFPPYNGLFDFGEHWVPQD